MRATPHWLGQLCTWWHIGGSSAVLIVPPLGYEYFSSHASLKRLADLLAARGFTVVRFDFHGNGDSAGLAWDPDRLGAWRSSVRDVLAAMREAGCTQIHAVGLRFGATMALELTGLASVVAWAPVVSGKRWMRELKMLAIPTKRPGFVFAGTVFSDATVAAMATVNVEATPTKRVMLLSHHSQPLDVVRDKLVACGAEVTLEEAAGTELVLDVPAEDAVVPIPVIERIAAWIGPAVPGAIALSPVRRVTMPWRSGVIDESFVDVAGMPGIAGAGANDKPTVVFVNSGSEVHVGPGRAWVEYSRDLNLAGYPTLRVDWPGWGENCDDQPGRPYDEHCLIATNRLAHELHTSGRRVVLAGLCSGAWVAMQAGFSGDVEQIIAINGHFYWRRDRHPVLSRLADMRVYRTEERLREERLERLGVWSILDFFRAGKPQVTKWMERLTKRHVGTLLLYSKGDDGIDYLRTRVARSLNRQLSRGVVKLVELDDLDHSMYHEWRRNAVVSVMIDFLEGSLTHTLQRVEA